RGFGFQADGPLDMRMDEGSGPSAAELVNHWSEREIARILAEYGEEPRARALARAIVRARPLRSTGELARVVGGVLGRGRPGRHPGTRTFQALRIAVNDELGELERFLADGYRVLRPRGRLAVLAYHSLEDRRVKDAFRRWAADCLCPPRIPRCLCGWSAKVRLLTRRPLRPSAREVARNPRAPRRATCSSASSPRIASSRSSWRRCATPAVSATSPAAGSACRSLARDKW